jgi:glycosyltransferase involved in cell wall biosynthesis
MDIIGGAVCLASGTPWIVSERGSGFAYGARLKQRVRRILGAHADCVVANSTAGLDYWQTYRPTQSLAQRIIANIVPLDEIDGMEPEVEQHGLVMDGPQWVVYVGRLEPVKNVRTLLRALELVVQNSKYKALI